MAAPRPKAEDEGREARPESAARTVEIPADLAAEIERAVAAGERIVLTRDGAPLAGVVPLEELRELEWIEAEEDRIDLEAVRKHDEDVAAGRAEPAVPWEQVKRDLEERDAAGKPAPGSTSGLDMFLAMSGTVHSGERDVSSDKYRHLGEAYATKP